MLFTFQEQVLRKDQSVRMTLFLGFEFENRRGQWGTILKAGEISVGIPEICQIAIRIGSIIKIEIRLKLGDHRPQRFAQQ